MTRAKQPKRKPYSVRILELLAEGPLNRAQLLERSGLEHDNVKDGLWNLRKRGMVIANKASGELKNYEITQKGRYHLDPASDPARQASTAAAYRKKLDRNRKRAAALREAARAASGVVRVAKEPKPPKVPVDTFPVIHRIVPAPKLDEGIVCTAIRCRPALQAVFP